MTSIFHHPHCKPHILHPIESIKCFFISLKWAYQRVKKGYCDKDLLYGVNNWFLEMLPEVVEEIRREKCTLPCEVIEEVMKEMGWNWEDFYDGDVPAELGREIEAQAKKKWDDILVRITFLLRESVECTCKRKNPYDKEFFESWAEKINNNVKSTEFCALEKRYLEEEKNLAEYREQCKKEAIELLIKWSHHLEIY